MEFYKDKKFLFMLFLLLFFMVGILSYKVGIVPYGYKPAPGLLLICAIFVFGGLSLFWKERNIKLIGLLFLVILAFTNIWINGLKFGIDFSGGTRIPIILEHSVDQTTMNEVVQAIKKRVSVLGLTEVKVYGVGNTQINVEIPSSDEERIAFIESVLAHQGVYMGIVDGKLAITGDHIFSTSITPVSGDQLSRSGAAWGVAFSVDRKGAEQFAAAAFGKADYPVYMYLDRPMDADIFYTRAQLRSAIPSDAGEKETLKALKDALRLEDNKSNVNATINIYILDELNMTNGSANTTNVIVPRTNKTLAIIANDTPREYKEALISAGYKLKEVPFEEMKPEFIRTRTGILVVNKIEAVGLLSAPSLSAGLTNGMPNYNYAITGGVTATERNAQRAEALEKQKSIESILKGGSLPVQISVGSRTTLPASLGSEFLNLSLIGIAASLIVISILIGIRYMNIRATLPIVAISLAELTILLSILGSFTIDLAAMAGIIAAIGVGVDAQIVITDELLKRDKHNLDEKMGHAFAIIKTNVIVASLSMLPLLFSNLVEVIGFATSTILGSLLGYFLSRPAYAAIVEKILGIEEGEKRGAS